MFIAPALHTVVDLVLYGFDALVNVVLRLLPMDLLARAAAADTPATFLVIAASVVVAIVVGLFTAPPRRGPAWRSGPCVSAVEDRTPHPGRP